MGTLANSEDQDEMLHNFYVCYDKYNLQGLMYTLTLFILGMGKQVKGNREESSRPR